MGIADGEQRAIFEEYHQIDNPARDPARGLGFGLSIVQRFADLLDHRVSVRSRPGKGSAFAIEVMTAAGEPASRREDAPSDDRRNLVHVRSLISWSRTEASLDRGPLRHWAGSVPCLNPNS